MEELENKIEDLKRKFLNITPEILTEYGPAIIEYLEKAKSCPWHDKCLLDYLLEKNRIDLAERIDLEPVFSNITPEILDKYGFIIIKYLEKINDCPWKNESLLNYLNENNRLDLVEKMLKTSSMKLTPEILDKYGSIIIKCLEKEGKNLWYDECLLDYLIDKNRLDLILKMNLEIIFSHITPEILDKYGFIIMKYLEDKKITIWDDDKCLFTYLAKNNRIDLMNVFVRFPDLTQEMLNEAGPGIVKYFEYEMNNTLWFGLKGFNKWLNNKFLFNYFNKSGRIDLILKMNLEAIFSHITPEILKEYGQVIIKYLESVWKCSWIDECLLVYLKTNNRMDLISKMNLETIFSNITPEILKEYGPAIIKYLEKEKTSPWIDECLLVYLKTNNRMDLISKMNLETIFSNITPEILNKYGSIIIKFLEIYEHCPWNKELILIYLVYKNRIDLIKFLDINKEDLKRVFHVMENILDIPKEVLKYKIDYLYNRNDELFSTLNFKILKLDIPLNILLSITLYPDIQEKIINLDNEISSKFLEIIKIIQNKKYDTVQVIESILNNISNYQDLLSDLDVNHLNENELNNLIYILQNENNIFNISSMEDLKEENFKRKKDVYFKNIDDNLDNLKPDNLKEAILESMYGINLKNAEFISKRYSYDFGILRKDNLNENIIVIVETINKIVNETDVSKLKATYQARKDILGLETDFMSSLSLEATIRKEYAKMYNETLYKINKKDLSQNPKLSNVTYQGKKIEIYEPGNLFHMQIHALGAYDPSFQEPDNFKDSWLRPKIAYHGICTSYIANNEIATARQEHPILGFSNYEEKALLLAGNYDLSSSRANMRYATSSSKPYNLLPPKTMIDATRHNHNEIVIERVKQDSNNMSKRTPNYIVYIVDDINNSNNFDENNKLYQENIKAAYDFDIPIVVIDRLKYARLEKEKCDLLEQEFNNSRNPEILRKLFLNYMNNMVGCRYFETNPKAEYNDIFSNEVICEFYKRITNLIKNDIYEMEDPVKTNEEILMMIKLLQHEKNSRYVPHMANRIPSPFNMHEAINEYQELLRKFKIKLAISKQSEVTENDKLEETTSKIK